MDLGLAGRTALVTGGSKGLGRAIAAALRQETATVAICARDERELQASAADLGAMPFACDLSEAGAATALVDRVLRHISRVDILVINTGGPPSSGFDAIDDDAWRNAFEALWMSSVNLIRACLPGMRAQRWGRVMAVTSISASEPLPNLMLSNAIRPGLHGMINALSRDVAADGVTVNALMPGYTMTDRLRAVGVDEAAVAATIPARRMGRPEEFAALAAFLASEQAGYITGQAIACDGGFLRSI